MVSDFNGWIGSRDLNCVRKKGTSFTSCSFACEGNFLVSSDANEHDVKLVPWPLIPLIYSQIHVTIFPPMATLFYTLI